MPMCMHPVLIASRAQSVPVSQPVGKVLKSTLTSTARAAGLASAAERPASQARASQGSHKVNRNFSTFSSLTIYSLLSCLQGKGKAPAPWKASQTHSASLSKSASQGAVPSSSQSSQKVTKNFSTFRMGCCTLQPDMRAPQGSWRRSGSRQRDA